MMDGRIEAALIFRDESRRGATVCVAHDPGEASVLRIEVDGNAVVLVQDDGMRYILDDVTPQQVSDLADMRVISVVCDTGSDEVEAPQFLVSYTGPGRSPTP